MTAIANNPWTGGDRPPRAGRQGPRIAFAGGGTGGHIYPALAIDGALTAAFPQADVERRFFGNRDGLEATLVTAMPVTFVPSAPLARRFSPRMLRTLTHNLAGVVTAMPALAAFAPSVLIATGGYVCFPVVAAARVLRLLRLLDCRVVLLEINAAPGLTSRLLAPLADEVWIAYDGSRRFFGAKAVLTGTPVRASLAQPRDAGRARIAFGLDPGRTTIVVMGGSQGARSINESVARLTAEPLPADWQMLHICGERDFMSLRERQTARVGDARVVLVPYLADPADAYAAADVVVARSGASTLAELAVTATPAILVPYPYAADDHQAVNATAFAATGAAVVVRDADLSAPTLRAALHACLAPPAAAAMRAAAARLMPPDAAGTIVNRITAFLGARVGHSGSPNEVARGPREHR